MKGAIIYKGKYGATQQYARWLGEELQVPVYTPDVEMPDLPKHDFMLIGSSVYIGKMLIKDWLEKHLDSLQNKKLFLFVVCFTPDSEKQKQEGIIQRNIPASLLKQCTIFFLPGRLEYKKLSWAHKFALKMASRFEKDPVRKNAMTRDINEVKKEHITKLVKQVRGYMSAEMPVMQTKL